MRDNKPNPPKTDGSPEDAKDPVCAGQALGFPHRCTLGFSPIESVTLDVFRCMCDVYATDSAQPLDTAMKAAEEQLGGIEGPILVAHVTALLRALRHERERGFSYLSLGCHHVSPDELAVTGLLKSVRVKDHGAFQRGIALTLDTENNTERTQLAVRALAAYQSRLSHPAETTQGVTGFETEPVRAIYLH